MSWHKQMTLRGVTPEQLLSDPKLLRTKVEKMHRPYDTVSSMVGVVPSPFHRFPINKHDLSSMYSEAMRPISEPLHGLPIASPRVKSYFMHFGTRCSKGLSRTDQFVSLYSER